MKKVLGGLIALVLAVLGVEVGVHLLISPKELRQHVADILYAQSGVKLESGTVSFQVLPWPGFRMENVTLSRAECAPFATARNVHASVSILPLLRREIELHGFTAEGTQLSLQSEQPRCSWAGHGPIVPSVVQDVAAQGVKAPDDVTHDTAALSSHRPVRLKVWWQVSLNSVTMRDTLLKWGKPSNTQQLTLSQLEVQGLNSSTPWIDLQGQHEDMPFSLKGHIGPFAAFRAHSSLGAQPQPWAFSVDAQLGKGENADQTTLDGAFSDPGHLEGLHMTAQGHWASVQDLAQLVPGLSLPVAQEIKGSFGLTELPAPPEQQDAPPASFGDILAHLPERLVPTKLQLFVGQAEFVRPSLPEKLTLWPVGDKLVLENVQLKAPTASSPLVIEGTGSLKNLPEKPSTTKASEGKTSAAESAPWEGHVEFASLQQTVTAWHTPNQTVPVVIDLHRGDKEGDKERVQFKGTVSAAGAEGALEASLARLGSWHDVKVQTQLKLADFATAGSETIALDNLVFESREGKATGSGSLVRAANALPHVTVKLHLDELNATDLLAALNSPSEAAKAPDGKVAAATPQNGEARLQAFLKDWVASGQLTANKLELSSTTYRNVVANFTSGAGKLVIDPLQAELDGSPLSGSLTLQDTPTGMAFILKAEPLAVPATLLSEWLGWKDVVQGTLRLSGIVSGQGADVSAISASLNGALGVGLVDGRINGQVLTPLAGPAAGLLKLGKHALNMRCLATHATFHNGTGTVNSLVLQAGHFLVTGGGSFTPATGALDLALRPRLKMGGTLFAAPVQVQGTWASPSVSMAQQTAPAGETMHQLEIGGPEEATDPCVEGLRAALGTVPALPPAPHEGKLGGGILHALGIGGNE